MSRAAVLKVCALVLILLGAVGLSLVFGGPDVAAVRSRVEAAGGWGPALYVALYAALATVPSPIGLVTATGGALFGLWAGAGLSLAGALMGALVSFGVGRLLGREAVDRLIRGRLARVDLLLADHGLTAVLIVRLVPLVPFIAINYAAGLSQVRLRHYLLGSAVGMTPGCLAYAALGAYGSSPWGLAAAGCALILLVVVGSWWARRLDARRVHHTAAEQTHA